MTKIEQIEENLTLYGEFTVTKNLYGGLELRSNFHEDRTIRVMREADAFHFVTSWDVDGWQGEWHFVGRDNSLDFYQAMGLSVLLAESERK